MLAPTLPCARVGKRHCLEIKLFFVMELRDLDDRFVHDVDVLLCVVSLQAA